jgi:alpha-1,6-mannosyltransferase
MTAIFFDTIFDAYNILGMLNWRLYISLFLFIAVAVFLNYYVERNNFIALYSCYAALFSFGLLAFKNCSNTVDLKWCIYVGVATRIAIMGSLPNLSNDFWRFLWDGHLQVLGFNPYSLTPYEVMLRQLENFKDSEYIYSHLNSPFYYSVYPPVLQFLFWCVIKFSMSKILYATILMKVFIVLAELVSISTLIQLLAYYNLNAKNVLWYVLNPLVIIEFVGNIHFEAFMICFLLLAFNYYLQQKTRRATLFYVLAIASKLLPLFLLPLILFRLKQKPLIKFLSLFIILMVLAFFPYYNSFDLVQNTLSGILLFYSSLQFNASFYWLIKTITPAQFEPIVLHSFTVLGSALAFAMLTWQAWKHRASGTLVIINTTIYFFAAYFILASTVQPWYIGILAVGFVFMQQNWQWVWLAIVPLTYITYTSSPYIENGYVVALEYLLVIGLLVFYFFNKWKQLAPKP